MNKLSPDVQCLRTQLVELTSLVEASTPKTLDATSRTNFEFVTSLFLITQSELLRSVAGLLAEQRFVAANILSRTMFEGMVLLLWMSQDREPRTAKWRTWAYVLDWRALKMKDREGLPVDDARRKRVMDGIKLYGPMFLAKKPKGDDPYTRDWTPPVKVMAEAVGLGSLYDSVYPADSQWVHWTAGGVGQALGGDGEDLHHDFARESFEVGAINTTFHAAFHVFHNAATWFNLTVAPAAFEPLSARFVACYERMEAD